MIVFSALMIWKSIMVLTSSESPVVVVLRLVGSVAPWYYAGHSSGRLTVRSGSMEPALQRGDILFLNNNAPEVNVGEWATRG